MNYDFADRVRKVLAVAREEALRLGHDYVGTEHILLGLVRDGEGPAAAVLEELGADRGRIRERVVASVRKGRSELSRRELPYTSRAKKVLEYAMAAARETKAGYVDTEHVLIGLLREEKGLAAMVLSDGFGVTLDRVRHVLAGGSVRDSGPEASGGVGGFRVVIDDASDASIYEQIVAQVREAVATGALKPGDRLAPVRRLADQLDIAPGTVARAYAELERLGVVVTEGARGTRIAEPTGGDAPAEERRETLVALLRPVAVAAFHMGASATELRAALDAAMAGILGGDGGAPGLSA